MSPSTILALAGVYGTVTFISNSITTRYLTDQWGRRKMILTGLSGVILVEIYAAVMQREFQNTHNKIGKGFTILGIYLFALIYCKLVRTFFVWVLTVVDGMLNSTTWLYGAEVLPIALRSKIMGIASASHFIVNVAGMSREFARRTDPTNSLQSPKQAPRLLPRSRKTTTTFLCAALHFSWL